MSLDFGKQLVTGRKAEEVQVIFFFKRLIIIFDIHIWYNFWWILFSGNFATPNFGTTAIPEEQKDFMNGIFEKVEKWLKNAKPDEKLMLDSCNPFQRRLIYRFVIKFVIN